MADNVMRDPSAYPTGMRLGDRFNLEKVSWGAIWAGVVVTIGMETLFLSFGIFINAVFGGSAIWTMAWYLVTMAVSFFVGGWTSARLSDVAVREICALHGLSTWGLATLTTAVIFGLVSWAALYNPTIALPGWGPTEQWSGLIWGGVILSMAAAYAGGGKALSSLTTGTEERTAIPGAAPIRRAS